MIVNTLSVLAAFGAILRIATGLILVWAAVCAIRRRRRGADGQGQEGQGRFYLVFLLAVTLFGLSVVSWPLLYMVLQSYVPQWPGIMCIQGVARIGEDSVGAVSYLPRLLDALEYTKPALVFLAGSWLVLHLVNRAGKQDLFSGRVLAALLMFGLLATLDGVAEAAYLFIPQKENVPAAGCCMSGSSAGLWSSAGFAFTRADGSHTLLIAAFFAVGAAVVLALTAGLRRLRRKGDPGPWLMVALVGAAASLPVGLTFLGAVAAPSFLRLSFHHCVYCLVASAPESLVAIALFVLGAFSVGWASMARWSGAGAEQSAEVGRPLLWVGWFGYLAALLLTAVRLATR